MKAFVYLIQAGDLGPVKIGLTGDPVARMASLQTGSPVQLKLLLSEDICDRESAANLEHDLHARLHGSRLHGEWFRFDEAIRGVITLYGCGVSLSDIVEAL